MAAVVRSRSREEIAQARDVALLAKRKVLRLSSEPAGVCALASVRRKGLWASLDIGSTWLVAKLLAGQNFGKFDHV